MVKVELKATIQDNRMETAEDLNNVEICSVGT